jgi:hypothetical protein
MDGRAYLDVARDLLKFSSEAHWRGAALHAYYALFLECRDALGRWGVPVAGRHNIHAQVRLKFVFAKDADLNRIGVRLERCSSLRNLASYILAPSSLFASATRCATAITDAVDGIALLDAIDGDPARRSAAVAAIPP